ncbi:MAG: hypothetical protein M1816_004875 [Peltula sp. TS41687]|nr:MAG: hypothetical protein M1816_004875 [Peltula sp. TS41687]
MEDRRKKDDDDEKEQNLPSVFTFTAGPIPLSCRLSFPSPSSPPEKPRLKRHRPLTDVDGEESSGKSRKKKRRLRLYLITSRLSLPFAAPSTHIVDRGSSKIAIWAKQKALGRNELRKAAIMNHVRKRAVAAQEAKRKQMELARKAFIQQLSSPRIPYYRHLPLPPSPLGLSNYDALDAEDGVLEDESCQGGEGCVINSDFNILEPTESVVEDYDSLDEIVGPLPPKHRPPSPPCEEVLDLMIREKERQKEVSFVQLGTLGY